MTSSSFLCFEPHCYDELIRNLYVLYMSLYNPNIDAASLSGKVALVTGGNSGIGYEVVKHLAKHGAKVYLASRLAERGTAAVAQLKAELGDSAQIELLQLDLSSIKTTKRVAEEFISKEERLDILVNNAAAGILKDHTTTEEGLETCLATNFFGPFILTLTLLPLLKKAAGTPGSQARIINVTSPAYAQAPLFEKIDSPRDLDVVPEYGLFPGMKRYGISKLTVIWFTHSLQRRFDEEHVPIVVLSVKPGHVATGYVHGFVTSNFWPFGPVIWWLLTTIGGLVPPEIGAYPTIFSATSSRITEEPDKYKGTLVGSKVAVEVPKGQALNPTLAKEMYVVGEKVVEEVLDSGRVPL